MSINAASPTAIRPSNNPTQTSSTTTPEEVLAKLTAPSRPPEIGLVQWEKMSVVDKFLAVNTSITVNNFQMEPIQLARAEVSGNIVIIKPERNIRSDFQTFDIPNNVDAKGFSPGAASHDYIVVNPAPRQLKGAEGLAAIGRALTANPTPGNDALATPKGTINDVGDLVWLDGDTNLVRSYVIPSNDRYRSATVINYTITGQHTMAEGFVMRFAESLSDGSIQLVTYGEGNALKMSEALKGIWQPKVEEAWTGNSREIFATAQTLLKR
jgi:hypothetical protein